MALMIHMWPFCPHKKYPAAGQVALPLKLGNLWSFMVDSNVITWHSFFLAATISTLHTTYYISVFLELDVTHSHWPR